MARAAEPESNLKLQPERDSEAWHVFHRVFSAPRTRSHRARNGQLGRGLAGLERLVSWFLKKHTSMQGITNEQANSQAHKPLSGPANLSADGKRSSADPPPFKRTNTDFGAEFKKKNKRAGQQGPAVENSLDNPCGVTVHDYGPSNYTKHSKQDIKNVDELRKFLPVVDEGRPDWANVR